MTSWDRERISRCSTDDPGCQYGLRREWAIALRPVRSAGDSLHVRQANLGLTKHPDDLFHRKTISLHPDLPIEPTSYSIPTLNLDQFLGVRPPLALRNLGLTHRRRNSQL